MENLFHSPQPSLPFTGRKQAQPGLGTARSQNMVKELKALTAPPIPPTPPTPRRAPERWALIPAYCCLPGLESLKQIFK